VLQDALSRPNGLKIPEGTHEFSWILKILTLSHRYDITLGIMLTLVVGT
jgi:hypothetical protein